MNVLVACEYSGRVRQAFHDRGHFAVSYDLYESDRQGHHIQGDVSEVLCDWWDLIVAFPPCQYLSSVQARWFHTDPTRAAKREKAIAFVKAIYQCGASKVAIENPSGFLSSMWQRPTQYVQPWMFGHPYTKRTGLWLKGLEPLQPTNPIDPVNGSWVKAVHTSKERSLTPQGLANAMAEQWG